MRKDYKNVFDTRKHIGKYTEVYNMCSRMNKLHLTNNM